SVPLRVEHNVVNDQLMAFAEEFSQRDGSLRPVEDVLLVNPDHGQQPSLGVERVATAGQFLLGRQQTEPGLEPLPAWDPVRKSHRYLGDVGSRASSESDCEMQSLMTLRYADCALQPVSF